MPTLDITSPEYMQQAIEGREQSMAPAYQRALRRNRQDLASRGLLRGGVGAASTGDLRSSYLGSLGDYGNQIGMKQYETQEQRSRAEEARVFQQALQKNAYDFQRERAARAEWLAEQRANQQFFSQMLGSAFGMVGTGVGSYAGSKGTQGTQPGTGGGY